MSDGSVVSGQACSTAYDGTNGNDYWYGGWSDPYNSAGGQVNLDGTYVQGWNGGGSNGGEDYSDAWGANWGYEGTPWAGGQSNIGDLSSVEPSLGMTAEDGLLAYEAATETSAKVQTELMGLGSGGPRYFDPQDPFAAGANTDLQAFQALSSQTDPFPDSLNSHHYTVIGDQGYESEQSAVDALHTNIAPFVYLDHQVTNGEENFVPGFGTVKTFVNAETGTIFNVTENGHLLQPGFVMRQVGEGPDGQWHITTFGVGNSNFGPANTLLSPAVWGGHAPR